MTLVELLIVVALIAVLAALAIPNFAKADISFQRQNVSRQLKMYLERARFDSIKRNAFSSDEMSKVIIYNSTSYALVLDSNQNGTIDSGEVSQISLSGNDVFSSAKIPPIATVGGSSSSGLLSGLLGSLTGALCVGCIVNGTPADLATDETPDFLSSAANLNNMIVEYREIARAVEITEGRNAIENHLPLPETETTTTDNFILKTPDFQLPVIEQPTGEKPETEQKHLPSREFSAPGNDLPNSNKPEKSSVVLRNLLNRSNLTCKPSAGNRDQ